MRNGRCEGIGLLGEGSRTALQALLAALDDRSNEIVYWAAFGLASMRATTALPALLAARNRSLDPATVAEIAHAIAHLTRASEES